MARIGVQAVSAAVAEVAAREHEEQGEQLVMELIPEALPSRFEPGSEEHQAAVEKARRNWKGRPAGAQNLHTRDMLRYVRRIYGDPLEGSARYLLHSPETLAAELNCSKLEAFDRLEKIRSDLRAYVYAKLAPTDDKGVPVVPNFSVQIGGAGPAGGPDSVPWAYLLTPEERAANGYALDHEKPDDKPDDAAG